MTWRATCWASVSWPARAGCRSARCGSTTGPACWCRRRWTRAPATGATGPTRCRRPGSSPGCAGSACRWPTCGRCWPARTPVRCWTRTCAGWRTASPPPAGSSPRSAPSSTDRSPPCGCPSPPPSWPPRSPRSGTPSAPTRPTRGCTACSWTRPSRRCTRSPPTATGWPWPQRRSPAAGRAVLPVALVDEVRGLLAGAAGDAVVAVAGGSVEVDRRRADRARAGRRRLPGLAGAGAGARPGTGSS